VVYLIEELHTTGRWPILVYVSSNMNGHMYSDTNKHYAYIILILGPCEDWEAYISPFQQVYELSVGNLMQHSFNPRTKFNVSRTCWKFREVRITADQIWIHPVISCPIVSYPQGSVR
jgi:hypothetical protein